MKSLRQAHKILICMPSAYRRPASAASAASLRAAPASARAAVAEWDAGTWCTAPRRPFSRASSPDGRHRKKETNTSANHKISQRNDSFFISRRHFLKYDPMIQ